MQAKYSQSRAVSAVIALIQLLFAEPCRVCCDCPYTTTTEVIIPTMRSMGSAIHMIPIRAAAMTIGQKISPTTHFASPHVALNIKPISLKNTHIATIP